MSTVPIGHAVPVLQAASRKRWLARRRKGLTATDVPAILGLSPWATPLSVWLDKVSWEDHPATYPMLRGLALENLMAAEYARQYDCQVLRPPLLVAHPEHRILLASLDRIAVNDDGPHVVELKTASDWREWEDGTVPDQYAAQVLTQLMVTGLPVGVIFADVAGRLETRVIERDPVWEEAMIPALSDWWHVYVQGRVPPPLHPDRDFPLLNRVWQPDPGETVDASGVVMGAVIAYVGLRERAKERDKTMTQLKTQVRAHMRTAARLSDPDTGRNVARIGSNGALTITWKPTQEETEVRA